MKSRVLIFTGDGKGKTTAAIGIIVRSQGHKIPTCFIQFLKAAPSGELKILEQFPNLSVKRFGLGFVPKPDQPDFHAHFEMAQKGFGELQKIIQTNDYRLIILDEILGALHAELITERQLIDCIQQIPSQTTLVLTGRNAPQSLIELADTVSEIKSIKHGFDAGIPAQPGIEF
jgi:cob(I)alamin adenosyltransferase